VFLHAYPTRPTSARGLELLRDALPELALTASHEVAPEIREYERTSTTLANAYIKPLAERVTSTASRSARRLGIGAPLFMMLSNGG
jgi:N-methylhydantoinase A